MEDRERRDKDNSCVINRRA